MNDIHPHWQATDDAPQNEGEDDQNVPVEEKAPSRIPVGTTNISRQPAAILGVVLVLVIGSVFFFGVEDLKEQLRGSVGDQKTDSAFAENSFEEGDGFVDATDIIADAFQYGIRSEHPSNKIASATEEGSNEAPADKPAAGNSSLPRNPYTVGSSFEGPVDDVGTEDFGGFGEEETGEYNYEQATANITGVNRPVSQPSTGINLWIGILALSVMGFAFLSRQCFKEVL